MVFFIASFCVFLLGIYYSDWISAPDNDIGHNNGPISTPFWSIFGAWNFENFGDSAIYSPAPVAVFVYALFANLALVNLLIAMFSETYSRVKARAEIEYRFENFFRVYAHCHCVHRLPPILNAPSVIAEIFSDLPFLFGLLKADAGQTASGSERSSSRAKESGRASNADNQPPDEESESA